MKKIGYIVNPYAGIGGSVALKGSDGEALQEKALALGAEMRAGKRAASALSRIKAGLEGEYRILTCSGEMGENEAKSCAIEPELILEKDAAARTSAEDTKKAAAKMKELGVDLIIFAGGDGTARDIYDAIGTSIPVVGIPAGTKMHSGIYATSPQAAGEMAVRFLNGIVRRTKELEVMDIDEEEFRKGTVKAKLYGYLQVPDFPSLVQGAKGGGHVASEGAVFRSIARQVVSEMEPDTWYIIGSGSTVRAVMEELGLPNTLLGVDIVRDRKLVASDVSEKQILEIIGDDPAKIIVTTIGGQGFIFGRGNQQISWRVIEKVRKENIIIVATEAKLSSIPNHKLRVDTGNEETDKYLAGPIKVEAGEFGRIFIMVDTAEQNS